MVLKRNTSRPPHQLDAHKHPKGEDVASRVDAEEEDDTNDPEAKRAKPKNARSNENHEKDDGNAGIHLYPAVVPPVHEKVGEKSSQPAENQRQKDREPSRISRTCYPPTGSTRISRRKKGDDSKSDCEDQELCARNVLEVELPKNFKMPEMTLYIGDIDPGPFEHDEGVWEVSQLPTQRPHLMDQPITFNEEDALTMHSPHHDLLVIETPITNKIVAQILVDNGSSFATHAARVGTVRGNQGEARKCYNLATKQIVLMVQLNEERNPMGMKDELDP
uniref:Uncharacterized protein n=1 Tax=Cannabis sativa TaxID=3483 RepID=A0A803Q2Y1_CANSA